MSAFLGTGLDAWWGWMAAMAWQATVAIAFVALLDRLLDRLFRHRTWPALLAALWWLAAAKLLLPPGLPSWWRAARPAVVPEAAVAVLPTGAAVAVPSTIAGVPHAVALLAAVWAAGAMVALLLRLRTRRRLTRWLAAAGRPASRRLAERAHAAAARLGMARPPTVRQVDGAPSPFVSGLLRPVVWVPSAWAESWPAADLERALLHEMAHVRRRDLWAQALWSALAAAYWFHPLVHVAARRAHDLRELACDATVARALGAAAPYRGTLLRAAVGALLGGEHPAPPLPAPFFARRSLTLARLAALERAAAAPTPHRLALAVVLLAAVACVALPLAAPPPSARAVAEAEAAAELAAARRAAAALTGDRTAAGAGTLHVRYAIQRLAAAQARVAELAEQDAPNEETDR
ncbi:MAG TPA: M56 family metallopeptidase [Thermoanaerobaculia bacterium]|nr:M56 family metallopeptidase [Thermoanaerobaculia bacterium]